MYKQLLDLQLKKSETGSDADSRMLYRTIHSMIRYENVLYLYKEASAHGDLAPHLIELAPRLDVPLALYLERYGAVTREDMFRIYADCFDESTSPQD